MQTVPSRMQQGALPFIQGKASKSPLAGGAQNGNIVVKKERSASLTLDRGGILGIEGKPLTKEVTITLPGDEVPSLRQVGFRVTTTTTNNSLRESQVSASVAAAGGGGGTSTGVSNYTGGIISLSSTKYSHAGISMNVGVEQSDPLSSTTSQTGISFYRKTNFGKMRSTASAAGQHRTTDNSLERIDSQSEEQKKKFSVSSKGWTKNEITPTSRKSSLSNSSYMNRKQNVVFDGTATGAQMGSEFVAQPGQSETFQQQQQLQQRSGAVEQKQKDVIRQNEKIVLREDPMKIPKVLGANGLSIKVIELWINGTLCEAEIGAKAKATGKVIPNNDPKEEKDMLQINGIDRKSLIASGISKTKVDRLYRSLFVYSFGFYEMMEDIFGHQNRQVRVVAKVWKIYGQLLEHCCRSDFENTVTQLEKENLIVVDQLQVQIQTQNNQFEQIQYEQTNRITGLQEQITSFANQQESLVNEKMQLEEEYRLADLAFNEEVGLRLQFEHKINELHSIHRELLQKHNRLLDEYNLVKGESEINRIDLANAQKEVEKMKVFECTAQNEIKALQWKLTEATTMSEKLKERILKVEMDLVHQNQGSDKFQGLLKEEKRVNEDLAFRAKNMTEKLELQEKNESIGKKRTEELKEEINAFSVKFTDYEKMLADRSLEILDLKRQLFDAKQEINRVQDQKNNILMECTELENTIISLKGDKKKIELQYEYCMNRNELITTDLEALQLMVKEFKFGRSELEEEIVRCKLKLNNANDSLKAKNSVCKELQVKTEIYEQRLLKVTVDFQSLQSKSSKEQEAYKQRISKLDREMKSKQHESQQDQQKIDYLNNKADKFAEQVDELQRKFLELSSRESEYKFLIGNQKNQINQMTNVIAAEEVRNQNLLEQISQFQAQNESLNRETKAQQMVIRQIQDSHFETIRNINQRHSKELLQYQNTEPKMSQMEYEDLFSQYQKCDEQKVLLKNEFDSLQIRHDKLAAQIASSAERYTKGAIELNRSRSIITTLKQHIVHIIKKMFSADKQSIFKLKQAKELQDELIQQKQDLENKLIEQKRDREKTDAILKESYSHLFDEKKKVERQLYNLEDENAVLQGTMTKLEKEYGQLQSTLTAQTSTIYQLQQQISKFQMPRSSHRSVETKGSKESQNVSRKNSQFVSSPISNSKKAKEFQVLQNQQSIEQAGIEQEEEQKETPLIKDFERIQTEYMRDSSPKVQGDNLQQMNNYLNGGSTQKNNPRKSGQLMNDTVVAAATTTASIEKKVDGQNDAGVGEESIQTGITKEQQNGSTQKERQELDQKNVELAMLENDEQTGRQLSPEVQSTSAMTGFFVPYHLSDFGKINYENNNNVNHDLRMTFNQGNRRDDSSLSKRSSASGGAYRLTAKHSAQVRNQAAKKLNQNQQQIERQSIGRLFQIAQERNSNIQHL